jgi:hypothetical protein
MSSKQRREQREQTVRVSGMLRRRPVVLSLLDNRRGTNASNATEIFPDVDSEGFDCTESM